MQNTHVYDIMHMLYMFKHAQKRGQATHAKQRKQRGTLYRRINVHVYEIMHMLYMCEHAGKIRQANHATQKQKRANRIDVYMYMRGR